MVSDHLCSIGWRSPPRSFVSLMTLYESNYIRLGWLLPNLREVRSPQISTVEGDVSLHLDVKERTPYTSLLNLSYRLANGVGAEASELTIPDLEIRIYHDARLAEACSCSDASSHEALRRLHRSLRGELDRRWARNMLLNKWLEYCAERGHRFSA